VIINARAAARPELGGVERWARELAARLPALRPGAYAIARPPAALVHRAGHAWEQLALPARAAATRAALVLNPANLAPLAWPRNVVVIHDVAAMRHPEAYSRVYVAAQRALLPRIARAASHVVTVSEFSRDEIVALLGVPAERVAVIPGGVDRRRFEPGADAGRAARALGLGRPYVLTVASRTARKNLAALDPVAAALDRDGMDLVAAGGGRPQFRPERGVGEARALGHVPDELLPGLYAGARAFVLPSRYEGFGLTCLEAMATGIPVVAADRGALPEITAGAALLVDPDDSGALLAAVRTAAGDESERARLRAAGSARAADFDWDATARAVDELCARVAATGRSSRPRP
jgi:glycosyltransferase involved in cell wall biosynthesis